MKKSSAQLGLALALVAAAAMWCYADLILVPYQVADATRSGRPRGNLSDLYPRWIGARELLLHRRDPYSPEVTREIQTGYYGRPLDPSQPSDPKDQQGFAYPVYVVFFLAPTLGLPFGAVQIVFRWLLFLLIAASVPLWLLALRWRISILAIVMTIVLVLGSFPAVQAIKLQQLTALVCILLAGCAAALVQNRLILAGILLACATIKPQLAIPFAAWLIIWAVGDWRSRQRLFWSFCATWATLVLAGELVLPGWIERFRHAAAAYLQYAGGRSLLDLALTPTWGRGASVIVTLSVGLMCYRFRRSPADSELFRWTMAIVLAAILAVIPTFAPYNQLLLIPAVLLLAQAAPRLWSGTRAQRTSLSLLFVVLALPWLSALVLSLMLLVVPKEIVLNAWAVPLWASWVIPFPVLATVALWLAHLAKHDSSTGAAPVTV